MYDPASLSWKGDYCQTDVRQTPGASQMVFCECSRLYVVAGIKVAKQMTTTATPNEPSTTLQPSTSKKVRCFFLMNNIIICRNVMHHIPGQFLARRRNRNLFLFKSSLVTFSCRLNHFSMNCWLSSDFEPRLSYS